MRDLPDLPVNEALPALGRALAGKGAAVLVAPPGAGKTTLVPLDLLGAAWRGEGRILLLEPRRLAARAAARRMAALLGEEPGGTVGYAMRMESRVSARTRILVVTEGILSRMILDDPELSGVSAVIFDEFHERSLDGDFGLALALDIRGALRPDLRLLVMSATLDGARVATLLGDAPVIESEGRSFPIDIRYEERGPRTHVEDAVADAARRLLAGEKGSILCFLPGPREIARTGERLEGRVPADVDIIPLHGGLDARAQDAAIRPAPPGRRKIVLATSIAETSVTIDGVTAVIDSGLSRLPKYEPATGLTRLETVRVSRASADQRAGRAGRTAPGIAVRLWRREQTASLPAFTPPEILEADLSGLLLDCAAFGIADPAALAFLDPPPAASLTEARKLLQELGALDETGRLTASGEAMRGLALPVRLAHMVAEAAGQGEARKAAELAMLITERGLGGNGTDLDRRLSAFRNDRSPRAEQARRMAQRLAKGTPTPDPSPQGGGEFSASSLPSSAGVAAAKFPSPLRGGARGGGRSEISGRHESELSTGALLLHAYPDRLARARGQHGRFVLANGRGGVLDPAEPLASETFLVVADLQGRAENARIASAAAITEADATAMLADRIETRTEISFDVATGSLKARGTRRLGAIVLGETALPPPSGAAADAALVEAIRRHGLSILPWSRDTSGLRARLDWLHRSLGAPWPDMADDALLQTLEEWLLPFMTGEPALAALAPRLSEALLSRVPYERRREIEALAPTHFDAPSGSRVPIRYEAEGPVLAIRVQELFGLKEHPMTAAMPLTLELLSPAHRPIQTTRDLPGFWRGSWSEVRAAMRGRYPKHPWPEDPLRAEPTSRAKPRKRAGS
jgi:ATP-dependent helicase HrpB